LLLVCLVSFSQPATFRDFPGSQDDGSSAPMINDFYVNATWAGKGTMFSFNISDNAGLNHAIFGCNNTGSWVNNANTSLTGTGPQWDNYTFTLNRTNGVLAFNYTVWNSNQTICATTGLRAIKVYAYNQTVFPTAYVYCSASPSGYPWQNTSSAFDNNTSTAAHYSWSGGGWTNPLIVNLSATARGSIISYLVCDNTGTGSHTYTTQMSIEIANKTGPWVTVFNSTSFAWDTYGNASMEFNQYTAYRFSFHDVAIAEITNYVNETQGFNSTWSTPAWNYPWEYLADQITAVEGANNWTSVDPYAQVILNYQPTSALSSLIDGYDASKNWVGVLQWSAFCNKLNITRQGDLKDALGNFTMVGSLPYTRNDTFNNAAFGGEDTWALYGFWYNNASWMGSYQNDTMWNITAAFQQFNSSVYQAVYNPFGGHSSGMPLWFLANGSAYTFSNRFYDECAKCIDDYIFFAVFLNVSGALTEAQNWWNYVNTHHWSGAYQNYKYAPGSEDPSFECESPFFFNIASILRYYCPDLGNYTRVLTDIGTRFLSNEWCSYQWNGSATDEAYVAVHMYAALSQRRLENTVGAWQALLGAYLKLNSTYQNNIKDMLYGNDNTAPAWELLLQPATALFNSSDNMFGWSSCGTSLLADDNNATAWAEILMFMMGIVPQTTTIVFPLEELAYEYLCNIDPTIFSLNFALRKVTVPVAAAGSLTFQYGVSPLTISFNQSGVWQITFTNSWNMISNVTFQSALPNNIIYLPQLLIHDVFITNLTCSEAYPMINNSVTISLTLQNNGDYNESFEAGLNCTFVNETVVGIQALTLMPGETATLNFTWIPTAVGLYTVNAYTSEIPYDSSPDDNARAIHVLVVPYVTMGGGGGKMPYLT